MHILQTVEIVVLYANYLLNYHRLAYSTNPDGLDIVIGQPIYEGSEYGFPITVGGIFYINCWESHEQLDVGSPTQSQLIIIISIITQTL